MSKPGTQLALTLLCFVLGLLLVSQFRTQEKIAADLRAQSPQQQLTLLGSLIDSNVRLRDEVARLEGQLAALESAAQPPVAAAGRELAQLRLVNGLAEARGPGVRVTLDADLEPYWLQDLLNELRNTGAAGLSLNGQRVLAGSVIGGAGGDLHLDGRPLARPYIVEAVGDPEALNTALTRPGGLILQLRAQYGPPAAAVARQPALALAAHPTGPARRLAQPAR